MSARVSKRRYPRSASDLAGGALLYLLAGLSLLLLIGPSLDQGVGARQLAAGQLLRLRLPDLLGRPPGDPLERGPRPMSARVSKRR